MILDQNMATKKQKRLSRCNNMIRELEGLEEGPNAEIHTNLFKTTLKKI